MNVHVNNSSLPVILIVAFILIPLLSIGQNGTITGKVIDSSTGKPLPFANVFINRTTIGEATREDGSFELPNISPGRWEVLSSFIGYSSNSVFVNIGPGETRIIAIRLKPSGIKLQSVEVTAERDDKWKGQLRKFKRIFFGKDQIASDCKLLNQNVLSFSEEGQVFSASAYEPLQIVNEALGYKMTYELKEFLTSAKFYKIRGNIYFEELKSLDENLVKKWSDNRMKVYQTSQRYFLKSLIEDKISKNGFAIYSEDDSPAEIIRPALFIDALGTTLIAFEHKNYITTKDSLTYTVRFDNRLEVHDQRTATGKTYKDVRFAVSWIDLTQPLIISNTGLVQNPEVMNLAGYMSDFRVAHSLPEDYVPGSIPIIELIDPYANVDKTREEIFLHIDKDTYYPSDILWFKGYVKYQDPRLGDSLSRVAYVELIDSSRNIIGRKILPIAYGSFYGSHDVPDAKGGFSIRAYTQWMRNFGENNFFSKAIPVLDPNERVKESILDTIATSNIQVLVQPSKNEYRKREKVDLDLVISNEYGRFLTADLSVSVVDLGVVRPVPVQQTITTYFKTQTDSVKSLKIFPVEKGITLVGNFKHKRIGAPALITAVLGNMADVANFSSAPDGTFSISGFQFYDSSQIHLQAFNKKGKPFGEFTLKSTAPPDVNVLPAPLPLSLERFEPGVKPVLDYENENAIQLKEVTFEAKKQERDPGMHGKGDFSIDADLIDKVNPTDAWTLLQSRIPGFRVYSISDVNTGVTTETVRIGPPSSLRGSGEPLLLIDGVPIPSNQTVAEAINQINVRDIERIEVTKYGGAALYGARGGDGVIAIFTRIKQKSPAPQINTSGFSSFPFYGFSPPRKFKSPDYSQTQEAFYSDNRTTLYWNPDVYLDGKSKQSVSFYTTDKVTTLLITVVGVTADGDAVEARKIIYVKD